MGRHLLADLYEVDQSLLRDEQKLMRILGEALDQGGFTVIRQVSHRFSDGGEGGTGMFRLSLSHATCHSFPELNYLAIDIFSCGPAEPQSVLNMLTRTLAPRRVESTLAMRGATNGSMELTNR